MEEHRFELTFVLPEGDVDQVVERLFERCIPGAVLIETRPAAA
jgi:hypothetical protein